MQTDAVRRVKEWVRRRQEADAKFLNAIEEWLSIQETADDTRATFAPLDSLTESERKLFDLLGENLDRAEMAKRLKIEVKTLDAHRDNIRKKLGIKSAFELKSLAQTYKRKET
jgi:DNA-binding CsgD family transcriptional regulator